MTRQSVILARGLGVIGATAALVTGITFAAFTSNTVSLTNNTLASSSASLSIWNGSAFADTAPGLAFTGVPIGSFGTAQPFYLKNNGDINLALTVVIPGTAVGIHSTGNTVTADDVVFQFTDSATSVSHNYTLAQLESGAQVLDDNLPAGAQGDSSNATANGNYTVAAGLAPGTTVNGQVTLDPFNFDFTGTAP